MEMNWIAVVAILALVTAFSVGMVMIIDKFVGGTDPHQGTFHVQAVVHEGAAVTEGTVVGGVKLVPGHTVMVHDDDHKVVIHRIISGGLPVVHSTPLSDISTVTHVGHPPIPVVGTGDLPAMKPQVDLSFTNFGTDGLLRDYGGTQRPVTLKVLQVVETTEGTNSAYLSTETNVTMAFPTAPEADNGEIKFRVANSETNLHGSRVAGSALTYIGVLSASYVVGTYQKVTIGHRNTAGVLTSTPAAHGYVVTVEYEDATNEHVVFTVKDSDGNVVKVSDLQSKVDTVIPDGSTLTLTYNATTKKQ